MKACQTGAKRTTHASPTTGPRGVVARSSRQVSAQPRVCTSGGYLHAAILATVVGKEHERAPLLLDLAQEVALRIVSDDVTHQGGRDKYQNVRDKYQKGKLACDPVTKPTASEGTMMVVRSSPSSSSMCTGPTRWAITHSTYFLARLRSASVPRISRVRECSKRSRSAPETRAIFSSATTEGIRVV